MFVGERRVFTTREAAEIVGVSHQYLPAFARDRYGFMTGRIMKVGQVGLAFVWDEAETRIAADWQAHMRAAKKRATDVERRRVLRRREIVEHLRAKGLMV